MNSKVLVKYFAQRSLDKMKKVMDKWGLNEDALGKMKVMIVSRQKRSVN